jgi:hypothetical protein
MRVCRGWRHNLTRRGEIVRILRRRCKLPASSFWAPSAMSCAGPHHGHLKPRVERPSFGGNIRSSIAHRRYGWLKRLRLTFGAIPRAIMVSLPAVYRLFPSELCFPDRLSWNCPFCLPKWNPCSSSYPIGNSLLNMDFKNSDAKLARGLAFLAGLSLILWELV